MLIFCLTAISLRLRHETQTKARITNLRQASLKRNVVNMFANCFISRHAILSEIRKSKIKTEEIDFFKFCLFSFDHNVIYM